MRKEEKNFIVGNTNMAAMTSCENVLSKHLLTFCYSGEVCHFVVVDKDCPSSSECDRCPIEMHIHVFGARHGSIWAAFHVIHENCEWIIDAVLGQ